MPDDAAARVARLEASLREAQGQLAAERAESATLREREAAAAVENARLFEELAQRNHDLTWALERQTATADIISLIASSPTDPKQVLEAIAERALRLCDAGGSTIWRRFGDRVVPAHMHAETALQVG